MSVTAGRSTYRHGDLRRALVAEGVELARGGGPEAVTLREATRRAGVSPNAAYRHFAARDDLLHAVWAVGQQQLADRIEDELLRRPDDPLRAVGYAYVAFAVAEPGLFRAAFFVATDLSRAHDPELAGRAGRTPYALLELALDARVAAGLLPAERRPGAEALAWSAVHGLALLLVTGPLRDLGPDAQAALTERIVDLVERGL